MQKLIVVAVTLALTGCGVETATTAASVAAMKKQEIEQGKKTMEARRAWFARSGECRRWRRWPR